MARPDDKGSNNGDERAWLEENAAGQALSAHIKAVLFDENAPKGQKSPRLRAIKDCRKLALALGLLGQMNTLETLKRFLDSHEKRLFIPSEIREEVSETCADIRLIRLYLIQVLGVKAEDSS